MKKKIVLMPFLLAMVVAMLPMAAFADNTDKTTTITEVVIDNTAVAPNGDTAVTFPSTDIVVDEDMTVVPSEPTTDEETPVIPSEPTTDEETPVVPSEPTTDEETPVVPSEPEIDNGMIVIPDNEVPLGSLPELPVKQPITVNIKHVLTVADGDITFNEARELTIGDVLSTETLSCLTDENKSIGMVMTTVQDITIDENTTEIVVYYGI